MSRIIRVIDNETIEISDYRNSGYLFDHNAPTIEDIRKQISNIDDWCAFKKTINPFVLYGKKEELQTRIDKAIDYIKNNCVLSDEWTDLDFCNFVPTGNIKYKQLAPKKVKKLLNILRGEDNE